MRTSGASRSGSARSVGVDAAVAVATLAWSTWRARRHEVSPAEERIFRAFNDRPDHLHVPVWAVMQSGSYAAVFVAAGNVARTEGIRRAAAVFVLGTAVWGGVKAVKPTVGRGRPEAHLDHVHVRGEAQSGLGFPSGHAAVSTTLALAITDPGPARRAAVAAAAVTGGARMYVGAHLPLDVAGGFAIGLLTRGARRFIVGL